MKAVVEKDLCVGCGLCPSTCPDVFEMQEMVAIVKVTEIPAESIENARQAAQHCPTAAIKID